MVKKVDDVKSDQNSAPEIDPQKKYLMDQFGSLMDQVGDGFGGPLQEELIRRLEQTIADFHQEVNEMLNNLKESSEKRHAKLKEIWENPDAHDNSNDLSETSIESEKSNEKNTLTILLRPCCTDPNTVPGLCAPRAQNSRFSRPTCAAQTV